MCIVICYDKYFPVLAIHISVWSAEEFFSFFPLCPERQIEKPKEMSLGQITRILMCFPLYELLQNCAVEKYGGQQEGRVLTRKVLACGGAVNLYME